VNGIFVLIPIMVLGIKVRSADPAELERHERLREDG
jgi:hypothetical protein